MNPKLPDWLYKLIRGHYPELPGVPIRKPDERATERNNLPDVLGDTGGTGNNIGGLINNLPINETDSKTKLDDQKTARTAVLEDNGDTLAYPNINNNSQTNSLILNQNKMSIFSRVFTSVETFVEKLFTTVKKDYLNLEPVIKSDIDNVIKWGNVVKGYITNPGSAGLIAGNLIQIEEDVLGSGVTNLVTAVIGEVVVDLGIVEVALADPIQAKQILLDHLATFKGKALADKLFSLVENTAIRITGLLDNNQAKAIIAVVYDLFFKSHTAVITIPPVVGLNSAPIATVAVSAGPVQTTQPVYTPLEIPQQLNPVDQKAFDTVSVDKQGEKVNTFVDPASVPVI